jgi:tetratricopeptide (TPR) repeat protein
MATFLRMAGFLALDLALVFGFWLGVGTPYDRLPFASPGHDTFWLFLPAPGTYFVLALIAHILLSAITAPVLILIWVFRQLDLPSDENDYFSSLCAVLGFIVAAAGWEFSQWPQWLIVIGEGGLLYLTAISLTVPIPTLVFSLMQSWRKRHDSSDVFLQRRLVRFADLLKYCILSVGSLAILLYHQVTVFVVQFVAIYLALVFVDEVVALWDGIRNPLITDPRHLNAQRWIASVPVVAAFTVLAASGTLNPFIVNTSIPSIAWIEAGTGALVCLIFRPLTDLARYSASVREQNSAQDTEESRTGWGKLGKRLAEIRQRGETQPEAQKDDDTEGVDIERLVSSIRLPSQSVSSRGNRPAPVLRSILNQRSLFERLNFRSMPFFLIAALCYHFLVAGSNFSAILISGLVPLVLAVTAIVTSIIPLLNNPKLEPTREVFLLLLFFIAIIAGITLLYSTVLDSHELQSLVGASTSLPITEPHFWLVTSYNALLEALLLLTAGQLAYFYLLLGTVVSFQQEVKSAEDLLDVADGMYVAQNYDTAQNIYVRAWKANPSLPAAWNGIGNVLYVTRRYDEALVFYDYALRLDPSLAFVVLNRGNALLNVRRYAEARDAYERALRLSETYSDRASVMEGIADTYRLGGDLDEALTGYQQVIDLDYYSPWGFNGRALVYARQGRFAEALENYQGAISRCDKDKPSDLVAVMRNEGDLYMQKGEPAEARRVYQEALAQAPSASAAERAGLKVQIGFAFFQEGADEEALATFREAQDLDPLSPWALDGIALVYEATGDIEKACEVQTRAVEKGPYESSLHISLAGLYRKLGRSSECEKQLARAKPLMTGEDEYTQACFASVAGNKDDALRLLRIALDRHVRSADWARRDPDLDFLRDDPQFAPLVGGSQQYLNTTRVP